MNDSEFTAQAPWWGGDLQTLRNKFARPAIDLQGRSERLHFALADGSGDRMLGMLDRPFNEAKGPLVILIHGLTGCEDSDYMRLSSAFHMVRGRKVLRLNLRGAGPSRRTCGGQYSGACAPEIETALLALDPELTTNGLFVIGYSLGGNILVNLLAEYESSLPIVGAATVSAAIDPVSAMRRLMTTRNWFYQRWLLTHLKQECAGEGAKLTEHERKAILSAQTLYDFDNNFTAPRNGFVNALDYYQRTAGSTRVPDIRVPTLMIHARNDPWIPVDPYLELADMNLSKVNISLTRDGGHLGFHANDDTETWHDRKVGMFLDAL